MSLLLAETSAQVTVSWNTAVAVAPGTTASQPVGTGSGGNLWVVTRDNSNACSVSLSTDGGVSYGPPNVIHPGPIQVYDIADLGSAVVVAFSAGNALSSDIEIVFSPDQGTTWSTPTALPERAPGTNVFDVDLTADPVNNKLHLIYCETGPGDTTHDAMYICSNDGATWFNFQNLSNSPGVDTRVCGIEYAPSGDVHGVFNERPNGTAGPSTIESVITTNCGVSWSPGPTVANVNDTTSLSQVSVGSTTYLGQDSIYVTFTDVALGSSQSDVFAAYLASGAPYSTTNVTQTPQDADRNPHVECFGDFAAIGFETFDGFTFQWKPQFFSSGDRGDSWWFSPLAAPFGSAGTDVDMFEVGQQLFLGADVGSPAQSEYIATNPLTFTTTVGGGGCGGPVASSWALAGDPAGQAALVLDTQSPNTFAFWARSFGLAPSPTQFFGCNVELDLNTAVGWLVMTDGSGLALSLLAQDPPIAETHDQAFVLGFPAFEMTYAVRTTY